MPTLMFWKQYKFGPSASHLVQVLAVVCKIAIAFVELRYPDVLIVLTQACPTPPPRVPSRGGLVLTLGRT